MWILALVLGLWPVPVGLARAQSAATLPPPSSTVVVTSGAQNIPPNADIAKVLRALAILRGRPAIVPLTEVTSVPLPAPAASTPPGAVLPPAFTPLRSEPPFAVRVPAPAMGVRVRRSFPFGSIDSTPRDLGINKGY